MGKILILLVRAAVIPSCPSKRADCRDDVGHRPEARANPSRIPLAPSSATWLPWIYFHLKLHFYSRLVQWTISPQALRKDLNLTAGPKWISAFRMGMLSGEPIPLSALQQQTQEKKIILKLSLAGSFQHCILDFFPGPPHLLPPVWVTWLCWLLQSVGGSLECYQLCT